MSLIRHQSEWADEDQLLRYDQYRGTEPQDHLDKLQAEAVAVDKEASRRKIQLDIAHRLLPPEPKWCEEIVAKIAIGAERNAGRILAYQVQRSHLRWSSKPFHYFLDVPGHTRCNIANAVFNRHGHLKQHLYGNFAGETNQGELLYIREVKIKPAFRKKGLACLALKQLLRRLSQRQKPNSPNTEWWFAVMHREDCEDSWRSAGFRVLDKTCFLGCCAMKGHACWNESTADPPPAIDNIQLPTSALDKALVDLVIASDFDSDPDKRMKAFKLLKAGANMKTSLAIQYAVIAGHVRDNVSWLTANGADINQQDSAGNTALHFAAYTGQVKLVRQLLNMSADPRIYNKAGFRPMDVCLLEMQFWREFKDARMGGFKSHELKYMEVVALLHGAGLRHGLFPANVFTLTVVCHKNGCTCTECIDGFLSPRMAFRLEACAEDAYTNCKDSIDETEKWPANFAKEQFAFWLSNFIPPKLLQKVSQIFAAGYAHLFDMFHDMLSRQVAPTVTAVKMSIEQLHRFGGSSGEAGDPSAVIEYLREGGRVEYALDALLGRSMEEHELTGDATFNDCNTRDEVYDLPVCANDDEYAFLLRHLCNDGFMPTGRYIEEDHDNWDWRRGFTRKAVYSLPSDDGQYD